MIRNHAYLIALAALLLLAGCMTPRQSQALLVLNDMLESGLIDRSQFDALVAALSPATWISDMIAIGSGLIGGGGAYIATNIKRNSMRRARGEPVTVPTQVEVTAAPV